MEHSLGYIGAILKNRFRGLALEELNAPQLVAFRDTINARVHAMRNKAGHTIHEMKTRAGVPCVCAEICQRRGVVLPPLPTVEQATAPATEEEPDPF